MFHAHLKWESDTCHVTWKLPGVLCIKQRISVLLAAWMLLCYRLCFKLYVDCPPKESYRLSLLRVDSGCSVGKKRKENVRTTKEKVVSVVTVLVNSKESQAKNSQYWYRVTLSAGWHYTSQCSGFKSLFKGLISWTICSWFSWVPPAIFRFSVSKQIFRRPQIIISFDAA